MRRRARHAFLTTLWLVYAVWPLAQAYAAPVIEREVRMPVRLSAAENVGERASIPVLIVREPSHRRRPFLLLLHGRPGTPAERQRLALPVYPANARYFAERGFVVLEPLRLGYGPGAGHDIEDTGDCSDKHFGSGVKAGAQEMSSLLRSLPSIPYIDRKRGIAFGESFGGLIAIALVAAHAPGIRAAVNIEGGDGGDSLNHPDTPCQPERLGALFAELGRTSRMPTLWLYSANDRFWGPELPRRWFAAFSGAGGQGRFEDLPADKNNGHFIFNRNALAWHPAFEGFVTALGSTPGSSGSAPSAAGGAPAPQSGR